MGGHSAIACNKKSFVRSLCAECDSFGHFARECPMKLAAEVAPKPANRTATTPVTHQQKDDDQQSVRSNSTVATCSDMLAVVPRSCWFCGEARTAAKPKRGTKACNDRCKSCFRAFNEGPK